MKRQVILIVLDGWGIGRADNTNPINIVKPANLKLLEENYPSGTLQASGIAVGLPWGEEGNSEVGHMTLGAGRVIYQHFPRIEIAIQDKSIFKNPALNLALEHARHHEGAVNLIGLISQGNVHGSLNLLKTLIDWCRRSEIPLKLHLFADGKDSPPQSVLKILDSLSGNSRLASLSGRYYGLDRDQRWDRTQLAYEAILGKAGTVPDLNAFVKEQYERGLTDQHLQPITINPKAAPADGDALIFADFREDSIRQIAEPFINPNFNQFPTIPLSNLCVVTITQYWERPPGGGKLSVAFPPQEVKNNLGEILESGSKLQLRIAETEKYAHVTYFFNGLKDKPLKNEFRLLVPSRNLAHPEEEPTLMAPEITNRVVQAMGENLMDFILVNYANADVVAHTGNFQAALSAVKIIDEEVGKVIQAARSLGSTLIITSDHGNIEQMIEPLTGIAETKHNPNPVPIYIMAESLPKKQLSGVLSDVAPTILELMNIAQPKEMTGKSLL